MHKNQKINNSNVNCHETNYTKTQCKSCQSETHWCHGALENYHLCMQYVVVIAWIMQFIENV